VGEVKSEKTIITVIDYCEDSFEEKEVLKPEDLEPFKASPTVTWIDICGIHDVSLLEHVGKIFGIHPLALEDILATDQRPKLEDFDEYLLIISRMLTPSPKGERAKSEQVSLILGKSFVISIQERKGDVFQPIRERIKTGNGRIRRMGPDYLAYALIDAVVDGYFLILEKLSDRLELIEEELLSNPGVGVLRTIISSKRQLVVLRKAVWPLREVVGALERGESPLIQEATTHYLRDVYDHTVQVMDTVETMRDIISGNLDIYLSFASNRMNEIMKVLTVIATVFMPLSFIAGIYGMNFIYMPELKLRYGYFAVLLIMLAIGVTMTAYFRRKGWV